MFVDFEYIKKFFKNKSVVLIGSGPTASKNSEQVIKNYDLIVRVNNYKIEGYEKYLTKRIDVHYSFYGSSIRKKKEELKRDGVKLCMCKCPNSKPIQSEWHEKNGKSYGVDFRYIYKKRQSFWFCDTYIPSNERFIDLFKYLGKHIPTTGFSAIWDLIGANPKKLYITGFDFFQSKIHNMNEPWKEGRNDDPIRHMPDLEFNKLCELSDIYKFIELDGYLKKRKLNETG